MRIWSGCSHEARRGAPAAPALFVDVRLPRKTTNHDNDFSYFANDSSQPKQIRRWFSLSTRWEISAPWIERCVLAAVLLRRTYVESVIVDAYAQRISQFHFVYLICYGQVSLASKRVRSKRLRELKLDNPISRKFRSYPRVSTSESQTTHLALYLLISWLYFDRVNL